MTKSAVAMVRSADSLERDADPGTRARLIDAAVDLFSSRGYDGVSVREIERLAGVNRGLAAYHYGTKDELWKEAIGSLLDMFSEEMSRHQEMLSILPPAERSRVLLHTYGRFGTKHPELFRLLVLHGSDRSERGTWLINKLAPLPTHLEGDSASGEPGDSEESALRFYMFAGAASLMFSMPTQAAGLFGIDVSDPEFGEMFTSAAVNLFLPFFSGAAHLKPSVPAPQS